MRSDESPSRMKTDREALRGYLDKLPTGKRIPIAEWYAIAAKLGLGRSDRQRLSDMRSEGYDFAFDFHTKEYHYRGWNGDSQPTLF